MGSYGLNFLRKLGFLSKNGIFDDDLNAKIILSFNGKEKLSIHSFLDKVMESFIEFASSS